ncbi:hypothetical protein OIK44_05630 [Janthinobacterium sp. hw3]|uniref:Uncharacterized protein n=1 Tax=Janthinobacterium fluminis TaxID=2987524 RepID=A0ABT5JWF9_9BURK|nr:hypothetical protein [Janthinobacterium fluminis]MDC8757070.1 hypothetical protein [Janthinobacterium fluminis]
MKGKLNHFIELFSVVDIVALCSLSGAILGRHAHSRKVGILVEGCKNGTPEQVRIVVQVRIHDLSALGQQAGESAACRIWISIARLNKAIGIGFAHFIFVTVFVRSM